MNSLTKLALTGLTALVLNGCENKNFTGEVILEQTGEKFLHVKYREYTIEDKKGYKHFAIIDGNVIDPFNKGDFVKVKLGKAVVFYSETKEGYEIVEYEILNRNLK